MAPSFRYSIGGAGQPVVPGSSLWESPLPMGRHHFQCDPVDPGRVAGLTHGAYFSAVRQVVENDGCRILSKIPSPEPLSHITDIDICLMKHGQYYHPAKLTVVANGGRRSFVLNVAVSDPGRRIIDGEIDALRRLGGAPGASFIPEVYGQGCVETDGGAVRMFLGQWFEGYHEFHLSSRESGTISVWGEGDVSAPLSREAAYLLYHQAASILTRCYNPATTEHVSRWHHAAGDFVVRCREGAVDVRLITVRHYGPLLKISEAPGDLAAQREQALAALLLFLVGLSIRMRLDRREGIGEMAWADDTVVISTWSGFLEGLSKSCFPCPFLPNPVEQFKDHLAGYGEADLVEVAVAMAAAIPATPEEKAVIETHLVSHMEMLLETICRIGFS